MAKNDSVQLSDIEKRKQELESDLKVFMLRSKNLTI